MAYISNSAAAVLRAGTVLTRVAAAFILLSLLAVPDGRAHFLRTASEPLSDSATFLDETRFGAVDLEGELTVLHEDFADYTTRLRHVLKSDSRTVELLFDGAAPRLRSGMKIRVTGRPTAYALRVQTHGIRELRQTKAASVPNTLGEQRTLVILVNFQDKPTEQPWTVDQARRLVFGTVSDYLRENSYGNTWLGGDVLGWFTIPIDSTYLIQLDGGGTICDQLGIARYAKQQAAAAGANLASYSRYVYMFPSSSCQWSGTASIGGTPSETWINGYLQLDVVAHELGHNLGLEHSHSIACNGNSIGAGCTYVEYGNGLDVMGWSPSGHFHAFQKERLGWLNSGALVPPITTVSTSGDYAIAPYETSGTAAKALKILKSVDPTTGARTWYYVEYRQALGFDTVLASTGSANMMLSSNVLSGVLVHMDSEDNGGADNYLLDMTPATYDLYTRDPALDVGGSFSDTIAGVTISTLWANQTNAGVRVTLAQSSCVRANPTVTMSPASQSAKAGSALSYAVTVVNNDSAGCGSSGFALQGNAPTGWGTSVVASTLLLSAAASGSTTVTITSPGTAAAASYAVAVSATNNAESAYAASAAGTYTVASSLSTTVATDKSSYAPGAQVMIIATVTSGGKAASGTSVAFKITKPNGTTVSQNVTTKTNGQAVYTLRLSKQKDPKGVYGVGATASIGSAAASGTTSFTVQ